MKVKQTPLSEIKLSLQRHKDCVTTCVIHPGTGAVHKRWHYDDDAGDKKDAGKKKDAGEKDEMPGAEEWTLI